MPYDFHIDRPRYFEYQRINADEYVIPFIEYAGKKSGPEVRVLEIGCGEGGVLKAFVDRGCQGVGVELSAYRVEHANLYLRDDISAGRISIVCRNIYEVASPGELGGAFDLIVLKDVIEHIPDQPRLLRRLADFLAPGGCIYFGFPPWQMPFGGHQQICRSKLLRVLPWFHLLPRLVYRAVLRAFGEHKAAVKELLELKDTGLSIGQFERMVRETGFRIAARKLYFINPIYRFKFGLRPRVQAAWVAAVPGLRSVVTTCGYYLVEKV